MLVIGFFNRIKRSFISTFLETEQRSGGNSAFSSLQSSTMVTEDTVLTIPTVSDCLDLITGTIAKLPVSLYKEDLTTGEVERIKDDHRIFLLNNEPNEHITAYDYKKHIVKDYLLHGKSYTYLKKSGNDIEGLYPLPVSNISVKKYIKEKAGNYSVDVIHTIKHIDSDETIEQVYQPYELLSILRNTEDGVRGYGLLEQGKSIFELALNESKFTSNILNKGALPLGVLESDQKLSDIAISRLRESWESIYGGAKNSGKTVILEEGLKYNPISLSPSELGLNESRRLSSEEICRLFNVPPSLVLGEKGYGNVEQDNVNFIKFCLSTIISCIEHQFDKSLLLEDEKEEGYYFRFDLTEISRTTEKELYSAVEIGMRIGALSINEARNKLDMPPLKHDYIMMNLGNIFLDTKTGKFIIPNTSQGIDNTDETNSDEDNLVDNKKDEDLQNKDETTNEE